MSYNNFCHGDLSYGNIMIILKDKNDFESEVEEVKIIDFGFAKKFEKIDDSDMSDQKKLCGYGFTEVFAAPENF